MCGVVGLVSQSEVSPIIYDALTILVRYETTSPVMMTTEIL